LTADQIEGAQGKSVRDLGKALGVRLRFKSVLPIGRGLDLNLSSAYYSSLDDSTEALAYSSGPTATCGLGMNLYIAPGGECYPCYALMGQKHWLGNVLEDGLANVLQKNDRYRRVTVDSNEQCRACSLRYLCGGFCRAWSADGDPDAAPRECSALRARASEILLAALETLGTATQQWQAAGLPAVLETFGNEQEGD
jgi:radical SAM protein with 4Fe4S-binding SPASM domain